MNAKERYCVFCMASIAWIATKCPHCKRNQGDYTNLPHQLKPNTILNRKYIVGCVIGEGGFGITYIGRDMILDVPIAIKEYYPAGSVNRFTDNSNDVALTYGGKETDFKAGKKKFLSEARILARLDEAQGIVNVRDFFEENNTAYIAMEYLDGITLEKYLLSIGKIAVDKTLELMYPIMDSLDQVHKKGLIHRDISPSNIMLTGKKRVKLLDFGAAREFSAEEDKSHSVLLKHGYAPEEQYRSRGVQGAWTDVYGLCATIYKCITGVTPLDSLQRIYFDDTKRPSELGIEIASEIEDILMCGMAVDQKDRYQSMGELKDAFEKAESSHKSIELSTTETEYNPPKMIENEDTELTEVVSSHIFNNNSIKPKYPGGKSDKNQNGVKAGASRTPEQLLENKKVNRNEKKDTSSKKKTTGIKPKKTKLKKILAYIAVAIVLIGIGITIFNFSYYITIGNERFPKNAQFISVSLTKIPQKHLERLSQFKNLYKLRLAECMLTDVDIQVIAKEVEHLENLEVLDISDNKEVTNLSVLSELNNLSELNASGTSVYDISILEGMNISILDISNTSVEDISVLEGTSIRNLDISNTLCRDITAVASLSDMYYFRAANNELSDISALESLDALWTLDLSNNNISDISALEGKDELNELYLSYNNIDELAPLTDLIGLYSIDLSHNNISDIFPIRENYELHTLDLSFNQIANVSALSNMTGIYSLKLNNNEISDLSPLTALQELITLTLNDNKISDISPLLSIYEEGEVIDLSNNNISDISAFVELQDIISLIIYGNPFIDVEQINGLSAQYVVIEYNENSDYSLLGEAIKVYIIYVPSEKIQRDIESITGENVVVVQDEDIEDYLWAPETETEETNE